MRIFLVAGVITVAVVVAVAAVGVVVTPDSFKLPQPQATVTVTATPQVVATVTATATVTAIVSVAPSPAGTAIAGAGQTAAPAPSPGTPSPGSGSPAHWSKVATVSGTANKKSAEFWLRSDAQKLSWKLGGKGQPFAHIYVTDAFSNVFSTVPDAAPDHRGPGSARLHLEKGRYYLDVYCDCAWSVTIWEQR